MKYVITGATSFIGVPLCRYLTDNGNEVFAIVRKNSKNLYRIKDGKNLHILYSDMNGIECICEHIQNANVFINLAWDGSTQDKRNSKDIHVQNVKDTLTAISVAGKLGCRLFIESGSQAEYGQQDTPTDELAECNPYTEYGKAKLDILKKGKAFAESIGIEYVHLRIFSVYGEYDHDYTLISTALKKMLANEDVELSLCTQHWNFLYIKDAIEIIALLTEKLLEKGLSGNCIINIASKDTRVLSEFVKEMKETTCSRSNLLFGKYKTEKLLSINPLTDKLHRYIGDFKFTPFNEGIYNTIEYLKKR